MTEHWQQRPEGGGRFAIWLIRTIARRGGRRLGRALLLPITGYFLLVRGPERRASRAYLTRVLGRPARLAEVARHIHAFAATILDRVYMLDGQLDRFEVRLQGTEALMAQLDRGGALMFGSHLGSFEVLRVLAHTRPDIHLRVVLDVGHNPAMTQLLDELNPAIARTVIDARQGGPSLVLAIKEATDAGALVALLVDRAQPGQPAQSARFLGDEVGFPTGPWLIASVLQVPVVLGFGLYRGGNRYDLCFEPFLEPGQERFATSRAQRGAAVAGLIQRYARRLEHHARAAPYNWFNFYDFWHTDDATADLRHPRAAAGDRLAPGGSDA